MTWERGPAAWRQGRPVPAHLLVRGSHCRAAASASWTSEKWWSHAFSNYLWSSREKTTRRGKVCKEIELPKEVSYWLKIHGKCIKAENEKISTDTYVSDPEYFDCPLRFWLVTEWWIWPLPPREAVWAYIWQVLFTRKNDGHAPTSLLIDHIRYKLRLLKALLWKKQTQTQTYS